jgi:hypothetical protein
LANQVAWLLGTVDAGATRTVSLSLRAEAVGEKCVRVRLLADQGVSDQAEWCTLFKGASALLFEMVDRQDPIEADSETSYPILLRNQGQTPITNVRIEVSIADTMQLVRAKGPSDHKLGPRTAQGQVLLFDPLPALASGEQAAYEVYVRGMRPGDARFRVKLTADQLEAGPVQEEENTTIVPGDPVQPRPQQKEPPPL